MGDKVIIDENLFELIMDFDEIATSDLNLEIHFYVFIYNSQLKGELQISEEIEGFLWYESIMGDEILSNTLKNEVIPYCLKKRLIK